MKVYDPASKPLPVRVTLAQGRGQGKTLIMFDGATVEQIGGLILKALEKEMGEKVPRPDWLEKPKKGKPGQSKK